MAFDPEKYIISVQGGARYLPAFARIIWFRDANPNGSIQTEMLEHEPGKYAMFKASIYASDGRLIATGHHVETKAGFADYLTKSETGSIARALGHAGYGTEHAADEERNGVAEGGGRPVDAPYPSKQGKELQAFAPNSNGDGITPAAEPDDPKEFRRLQGEFKNLAMRLGRDSTSDALFALYNKILRRTGEAAEGAPDVAGLEYCITAMKDKLEKEEAKSENVPAG